MTSAFAISSRKPIGTHGIWVLSLGMECNAILPVSPIFTTLVYFFLHQPSSVIWSSPVTSQGSLSWSKDSQTCCKDNFHILYTPALPGDRVGFLQWDFRLSCAKDHYSVVVRLCFSCITSLYCCLYARCNLLPYILWPSFHHWALVRGFRNFPAYRLSWVRLDLQDWLQRIISPSWRPGSPKDWWSGGEISALHSKTSQW